MSDPTTERPRGGVPFVARIVGGIVLVALVVGAGLWVERLTDDDLALPDRLVGIDADDSEAALEVLDEDDRGRARDNTERLDEFNSEALSEAYDGAEAVTRRYGLLSNSDLRLLVTAVRAGSGPPVPVAFDDPEMQGFAAARNELVDEGEVTCLVTRSSPPAEGGEASEEDLAPTTVLCQRTGGDLTVRVQGNGEVDVDEVAEATDDVWEDLT